MEREEEEEGGEEEGLMFGIGSKYGGSEERGPDPDRDPSSASVQWSGKLL